MTSDITGATVDDADNVTVGKSNVQQVVNVGHDGHDDHDHAATIRLVYELVSNLTVKIDSERHECNKSTAELRKDLDELRRIAHETQRQVEGLLHKAQAAVTVNQTHRIVFTAGFALLMLPLPLFYNDVRLHVGVSWQFALTMAVVCYLFSAVAWSYMWWGK